jgi:hypothetical protein
MRRGTSRGSRQPGRLTSGSLGRRGAPGSPHGMHWKACFPRMSPNRLHLQYDQDLESSSTNTTIRKLKLILKFNTSFCYRVEGERSRNVVPAAVVQAVRGMVNLWCGLRWPRIRCRRPRGLSLCHRSGRKKDHPHYWMLDWLSVPKFTVTTSFDAVRRAAF